jgi:hypothetical protein
MAWVDVALAHLVSDRRQRALLQRASEADDRLERIARKLARRQPREVSNDPDTGAE